MLPGQKVIGSLDRLARIPRIMLRVIMAYIIIEVVLEEAEAHVCIIEFKNTIFQTLAAYSFEVNLQKLPSCHLVLWPSSTRQRFQSATIRHLVISC